MHDDLVLKFKCQHCAGRGERRRDVFLTITPDYGRWAGRLNQDWPT